MKIFTGDKEDAGCDSNVFLTVFGDRGDTGEREVDKSNNFNKFERNQVIFSISWEITSYVVITTVRRVATGGC